MKVIQDKYCLVYLHVSYSQIKTNYNSAKTNCKRSGATLVRVIGTSRWGGAKGVLESDFLLISYACQEETSKDIYFPLD